MCDKVYYDQKCLMCNVVVKISVQHIIVSYALKSDEPLSHSHSLSLPILMAIFQVDLG